MNCNLCFKLDEDFLDKYKTIQPPFGYAPLGEMVYRRTYSRKLDDGTVLYKEHIHCRKNTFKLSTWVGMMSTVSDRLRRCTI